MPKNIRVPKREFRFWGVTPKCAGIAPKHLGIELCRDCKGARNSERTAPISIAAREKIEFKE